MDSDFDVCSDYDDYEIARTAEGGPRTGRGDLSSGMGKFMLGAFLVMIAIFGLIGIIAHFAR